MAYTYNTLHDGRNKNVISSNLRTRARQYAPGITHIPARPNQASWAIQNLSSTETIKLWFGAVPVSPLDENTTFLNVDKTTWSGPQDTQAQGTLGTYGISIGPGEFYEPFVSPTSDVYIFNPSGSPINANETEG